MATKDDLITAMANHIGQARAIPSKQLAERLEIGDRRLRTLITECRMECIAICGHPSSGYYMAETEADLKDTLAFLKSRAMTSLTQMSRLSGKPLAELAGQLMLTA